MADVLLFIIFIVLPFFRVFQGTLLQNIHNIIAVSGIGIVFVGLVFNRLSEYIEKYLKYVIPLLISTIAVHFFLKTYDSAQIKITLLEVGGPIVLITWIIKRIDEGSFTLHKSRRYVILPALLYILSAVISFYFSVFKLETFEPGLIRRFSYLGVFIVIIYEFNCRNDFRRILNWALASCFFVVIYGFIQYFGLDWHIWKGAFKERIFSTFGNPNFYAAWLVLLLPFVMIKTALTKKWYYGLLALGIIFNLVQTGTKGSWVGVGVEISVYIILYTLYLIKGDPRILKRIAACMITGILLITISGIVVFSIKRIDSIRFRLFTWGATMKMISEPIFYKPLKTLFVGHGIESFKLVYPAYRRPEIFHIENKHNTETDHAHNEFVEIFYDEGFMGIVIYLWLLTAIFYAGLKRLSNLGLGGASSEDEYFLVALISGTAGMIAHSSVSVHVRFVSSGYILWTFLGLLVVHTAPVKWDRETAQKRLGLLKISVIMLLAAVIGFNSLEAAKRFTANIYHNRAIAFSKQRKWAQALELYKKVQMNHPSFIMAYYFEGNVYNDKLSEAMRDNDEVRIQENYKNAIDAYNRVLSMYPNYVQVHFQEGMLHLKVGNTEEAVESFRKYLNVVDPMYPFTYYRLGMIKAQENDLRSAQWYMEEPLRRIPLQRKGRNRDSMMVEAYMNLANIYLVQKKLPETEGALIEALKVKENMDTLTALGRLYEGWGKRGRAVKVYERMLQLRPENKEIENKLKKLKS
ncbi:MAG: tetratricopeptide repeat protein [Elusimicrobia bacterium]|nr:tetratricopeptide repeat protein [Elusimicrobiota bacterium]